MKNLLPSISLVTLLFSPIMSLANPARPNINTLSERRSMEILNICLDDAKQATESAVYVASLTDKLTLRNEKQDFLEKVYYETYFHCLEIEYMALGRILSTLWGSLTDDQRIIWARLQMKSSYTDSANYRLALYATNKSNLANEDLKINVIRQNSAAANKKLFYSLIEDIRKLQLIKQK